MVAPAMTPAASRLQEGSMERTAVNPWKWSLNWGYNQAEIVEGPRRQLICAGQTSVDADGNPQHPGDMRAQVGLAMDNLEAVLAGAGMTLANVVRFNVYTTDVDGFLACADVTGARFGAAGAQPPGMLLGVARLALPELLVELEATAAD
jgi:enamine deaminase RidA (YjgF/YER057c/UK114 family)